MLTLLALLAALLGPGPVLADVTGGGPLSTTPLADVTGGGPLLTSAPAGGGVSAGGPLVTTPPPPLATVDDVTGGGPLRK
jgi:hypothetical protein